MINEKLRARADRVVDWDAVSRPQDRAADDIHLTPTGLDRRARFIADAVESCNLTDGADPVGP